MEQKQFQVEKILLELSEHIHVMSSDIYMHQNTYCNEIKMSLTLMDAIYAFLLLYFQLPCCDVIPHS
jgi:hypothetical protein